jgi:hypothetical protein
MPDFCVRNGRCKLPNHAEHGNIACFLELNHVRLIVIPYVDLRITGDKFLYRIRLDAMAQSTYFWNQPRRSSFDDQRKVSVARLLLFARFALNSQGRGEKRTSECTIAFVAQVQGKQAMSFYSARMIGWRILKKIVQQYSNEARKRQISRIGVQSDEHRKEKDFDLPFAQEADRASFQQISGKLDNKAAIALFIFDDRIESIDFGCSKCLLIAR